MEDLASLNGPAQEVVVVALEPEVEVECACSVDNFTSAAYSCLHMVC